MKNIVLSLALSMCLPFTPFLCAQESVFSTGIHNEDKLPPLEIFISGEMLSEAYNDYHELITEEYTDEGSGSGTYSTFMYRDRKINDTRNLFTRYLEHDLLYPGEDVSGRIEMKVLYYNYTERASVGVFINVFTFGLGAMLGIPNGKNQTLVEVEATIYNRKGELVGRYFSPGKKTVYQSLYARKLNERESNLEALKKALLDLNAQIMAEKDYIIGRL